MDIGLARALTSRRTLLSAAALAAAIMLWIPANALIQELYPDRPVVPDIVFTLTPEIPWLAYVTDPLIAVSMGLYLWQALRVDRTRLPFYIFAVAALYFTRPVLMILTPLGRPTGNTDSYGIFECTGLLQHGMFPSGHQMLATLAYFLIDRGKVPRLKRIAGYAAILEGVTLLLSRGHYSIDVVGGALVAWIIAERLSRIKDRFDLLPPRQA
jgi:membrane-associated phospholipid phosphatase